MKSISTYIKEATEKVELAHKDIKAYDEYNENVKDFTYEERCKILELSEKKNKSFRAAVKAVKDLHILFDLNEPEIKYYDRLVSGLYHITSRWEYMNKRLGWS